MGVELSSHDREPHSRSARRSRRRWGCATRRSRILGRHGSRRSPPGLIPRRAQLRHRHPHDGPQGALGASVEPRARLGGAERAQVGARASGAIPGVHARALPQAASVVRRARAQGGLRCGDPWHELTRVRCPRRDLRPVGPPSSSRVGVARSYRRPAGRTTTAILGARATRHTPGC